MLSENKAYVALTRETHDVEIITDNKERLLEAISDQQDKTSTLDHADELLAALKAQQAAHQGIDDTPASWKANHAQADVAAEKKNSGVIEDSMRDKQSQQQQQQRALIEMSM